jgi:hypothetical protein
MLLSSLKLELFNFLNNSFGCKLYLGQFIKKYSSSISGRFHCLHNLFSSKFKTIFKQEEYLNIKDFKMHSILTRFRISAHQLEIDTGCYTTPKTPLENRLCKQ